MRVCILVIDNDLTACKQIKYSIQTELTEVYYASSIQEALQFLSKRPFTVVILNMALSRNQELIEAMSHQMPEPLVVLSCDVSTSWRSAIQLPDGPFMVGSACSLETSLQKARDILHGCGPSSGGKSYRLANGSNLVIDLAHRQVLLDSQHMELTRKNFELL